MNYQTGNLRTKMYAPMGQIRVRQISDYLGSLIGRSKLPPLMGKRILDLGSGNGFGLKVLKLWSGEPIGIEIDEREIRESLEYGHKGGEILLADATTIEDKFGQGSMDLITGFHAPIYDDKFLPTIDQSTRIVKEGGHLLLTVPSDYEAERLETILRGTEIDGRLERHPEFLFDKYIYFGQRRK